MRKSLTALALAATVAVAAVAAPHQAEARNGRVAAGIIGGFAAGAIIGSMVAQQGYYYGPGPAYYYGPGYYYGPPVYAYEPPPVYVAPPRYYRGPRCWVETDPRGFGYYRPCR